MAMAISIPRYTIADLERFPNDGNRYELLDGVLLVTPARYPIDSKWEEIDEHWLAVEVLSRSSRVYDREIKRDAYIALGVPEVWLVDRWNTLTDVFAAMSTR